MRLGKAWPLCQPWRQPLQLQQSTRFGRRRTHGLKWEVELALEQELLWAVSVVVAAVAVPAEAVPAEDGGQLPLLSRITIHLGNGH